MNRLDRAVNTQGTRRPVACVKNRGGRSDFTGRAMSARRYQISVGHDPDLDYHEWITSGVRVKVNRNGVPNPRMYVSDWTRWVCNNPERYALAFVNDEAIREDLNALDDAS